VLLVNHGKEFFGYYMIAKRFHYFSVIQLSDETYASLVSVLTDIQNLKVSTK